MHSIDLNLLAALDVILEEESVLKAAKRMGLSAPAMSRTLSRIRDLVGDPLLVRAGRRLVPTPRARELKPRLRTIVAAAHDVLREGGVLDKATLARSFSIRTGDGVVGLLGPELLRALRTEAPNVSLRFWPEGNEDLAALREGGLDLDIGAIGAMGPEIRVQSLCRDRFVGVVRAGHPLATGKMTVKRYVEHAHIGVSRMGKVSGPIDKALRQKKLGRTIAVVAPGYYAALELIASSDLVGALPSILAACDAVARGLVTFPLPVVTPHITLAQAWHPRLDADPAHRWLRSKVRKILRGEVLPESDEARGDWDDGSGTARVHRGGHGLRCDLPR